jgi:hypothetical protein
MRGITLCLATVLCCALAAPARAGSRDFDLSKLKNPRTDPTANDNFRIFVNQLGAALSSFDLAPPGTLGHSAFGVAFEYAAARIDNSPGVWPTRADHAPNLLLLPSLHVRKGLPFSFEVGARLSFLQSTQMTAGSAEVKWALHEGFFNWPDLGVRGHVTHLIGARDLSLTTAGLDVGIGHRFALGGLFTLTPYAGWDLQWLSANTGIIDFRPDRSSSETPLGSTADTGVFDQAQMHQNHCNRFYLGLRWISSIVEISGEASFVRTYGGRQVIVGAGTIGLNF